MKVLFRFDASEALRRTVTARSTSGITIVCTPESEDSGYELLLPEADVLWHVLKPVDERQIQAARSW